MLLFTLQYNNCISTITDNQVQVNKTVHFHFSAQQCCKSNLACLELYTSLLIKYWIKPKTWVYISGKPISLYFYHNFNLSTYLPG